MKSISIIKTTKDIKQINEPIIKIISHIFCIQIKNNTEYELEFFNKIYKDTISFFFSIKIFPDSHYNYIDEHIL